MLQNVGTVSVYACGCICVVHLASQVVRVSEAYLKEDVKDVVITIPSYYTHVERSAIVAGTVVYNS